MNLIRARRPIQRIRRRLRETRMLMTAFRFPYRPVAAQIIPIRRCNLACGVL